MYDSAEGPQCDRMHFTSIITAIEGGKLGQELKKSRSFSLVGSGSHGFVV
ncbi:hypothetical protein FH603_5588 [Spirosoma sp. LMG 31447]|uniref:Uncharacterized protein n=1 Tax=Spirosoma utsteinense TaxID=2585773 RepID=A0ABR6WG49_9BACT|nr:hypothetical protein [Spirosoma utsteinense]